MSRKDRPDAGPDSSPSAVSRARGGPRRRKWVTRILLLGVSGLFALLVGEGAVRVIAPQPLAPSIRESVGGVTLLVPDVRVRYFSPGEYDVHATVNAQRLRAGRLYDTIPPPETIRVVALGDSFTFSTGVEDDETYPHLLEARLDRELADRRVEVINAGIHGTGLGDQAIWYDRSLRRFSPDFVVVTLYANDIDDEILTSRFERADGGVRPRPIETLRQSDQGVSNLRRFVNAVPGYLYLTQHSQLLNLVRRTATTFLIARRSPETADPSSHTEDVRAAEDAASMIADELMWLQQRVAEDGADLLAVLIPPRADLGVEFGALESAEQTRILRVMLNDLQARSGISVLDLEPLVQRESSSGTSLYFEKDIHFRPDGYRLLADAVADRMLARLAQSDATSGGR